MINGNITFAGAAIFDTNSLMTATRVNTFKNVTVMSEDGDFASSVSDGDAVVMAQPYIFSPSTPTPGLWSVGGFTFDLATSTVDFRSSQALFITGTGTISGNGFMDTPGTWSFTTQTPFAGRGVFSFSSGSSAAGVPDGGTTVALLGLAFFCVELARRKLKIA